MEENFSKRAKEGAVSLANQILDERGKLTLLEEAIEKLKEEGYFQSRDGYSDADIIDHQLHVLEALKKDSFLRQRLHSFGLPLADQRLEEMVAITLDLPSAAHNRDVTWAVLSALLCPLRQSVGSCFGTAPAILVHEEYPHIFLDDLQSLLSTGKLARVFGGLEYTVPMSPSPGLGDLKRDSQLEILEEKMLKKHELKKSDLKNITPLSPKLHQIEQMKEEFRLAKWRHVAKSDHLLLKMWEFTIASFADVKTEFSRWNLFSSLGLHPDEKGGIGELIFQFLQEKLDEANQKLQETQTEYEIAFDQLRATESLMRNISSEAEGRRMKAEHHSRLYHLRACEEMRDKYNAIAQNTAEFFPFLIESIVSKFQEYFQEVYDAEMQDVKGTPYDDSPAGFRLLYKHGRAHVASWTFIRNQQEYIQALKEFFIAIEHPLIELCEWKEGKEQIPHLITSIVHLVSSDDFLISAFLRLAKAHRVPLKKLTLDQLDELEKKPWSYTSGGTMPTLVKTYFRREGTLSEEAKWVESPLDLLVFILDTLKIYPFPKKRILMTSPTHAFSLLPSQLEEGADDRGFSYTYARDRVLYPGQDFYKKIRLDTQDQLFLLRGFAKKLPPLKAHEIQQGFTVSTKPLTPAAFAKKIPDPRIDAYLYEALPIVQPASARSLGVETFVPLTRRELHDALAAQEPLNRDHDVHAEIASLLREKSLAPPAPFIFADSNWVGTYFAFALNPATDALDLFRTDKNGITGAPLKEWAPFLDGTATQPWGIYLRPYEYAF